MSGDIVKDDILPFLFAPAEKQELLPAEVSFQNSERMIRDSSKFGDELLPDSLVDFYELFGDQVDAVARLLGETRVRDGIKDKLALIMASSVGLLSGGLTQIIAEQPTAYVNGQILEKFPVGMNIMEEFVEGGIAMSSGVILGELLYNVVVAKAGMKPDKGGRIMMWTLGSMTSYLSMFFVGDWLHQVLDIADVPTIEILQKLIGS